MATAVVLIVDDEIVAEELFKLLHALEVQPFFFVQLVKVLLPLIMNELREVRFAPARELIPPPPSIKSILKHGVVLTSGGKERGLGINPIELCQVLHQVEFFETSCNMTIYMVKVRASL